MDPFRTSAWTNLKRTRFYAGWNGCMGSRGDPRRLDPERCVAYSCAWILFLSVLLSLVYAFDFLLYRGIVPCMPNFERCSPDADDVFSNAISWSLLSISCCGMLWLISNFIRRWRNDTLVALSEYDRQGHIYEQIVTNRSRSLSL
jgi:hypothetical protein